MLKESLGQLISASCHLKEKRSFSLRTHPSIFTSAATKLFEQYNLTKCVLWHIMDISPSQCLGKLKSSKTSRKNLSEVVSRRKVEQTAQVQNILTTNTIMQQLFWDSGHCAIKVRITIHMYISKSVKPSIHCLVIVLTEICWDVKLFIVINKTKKHT